MMSGEAPRSYQAAAASNSMTNAMNFASASNERKLEQLAVVPPLNTVATVNGGNINDKPSPISAPSTSSDDTWQEVKPRRLKSAKKTSTIRRSRDANGNIGEELDFQFDEELQDGADVAPLPKRNQYSVGCKW